MQQDIILITTRYSTYPGAQTQTFSVGVVYARIFFEWNSTNSVEDRRQIERGSGGGSPLVRGNTKFVNKLNPYSD
jgi:hypothetical protein